MKIGFIGHKTPERLSGEEKSIEEWIRLCLSTFDCTEANISLGNRGSREIFTKVVSDLHIPLNVYGLIVSKFTEETDLESDKYMIDDCDTILAVFDGIRIGNTWLAVQYAESIGKTVIYYQWRKNYT